MSLSVAPGHRLGVVGENGAGKSTLLRLLAGVEDPDSGQLTRPAEVGFLHQEMPYAAAVRVEAVIEGALARLRELEREVVTAATALSRRPGDSALESGYAAVLQATEAHSVWDADRRAALTLAGLGLERIDRSRRLGSLSGGERSRLMLAALLIRRPAALLLDEPTNHLDDGAIAFLEARLRELPGAVVVASHDRVFLDEVCTGIYDLDPARGGPTCYGGAYRHYLREKRIEQQNWGYQWRTEQDQLRALRLSVAQTTREVSKYGLCRGGGCAGSGGGAGLEGPLWSRAAGPPVRMAGVPGGPAAWRARRRLTGVTPGGWPWSGAGSPPE